MPKDELDTVSDLRYSWKKLHKLATEVSDGLAKMQASAPPHIYVSTFTAMQCPYLDHISRHTSVQVKLWSHRQTCIH